MAESYRIESGDRDSAFEINQRAFKKLKEFSKGYQYSMLQKASGTNLPGEKWIFNTQKLWRDYKRLRGWK